jgi:hypothetical protein
MTFAPQAPYEQKTTRPTAAARESARSKRTLGEDAVPAPGHSTAHLPADYKQINGWGADLDPKDRPSVPKELPSDVMTARGDVKHRQRPHTKVFRSNEHPDLTPVFGETIPPKGLSGLLRAYAFEFGEASNRHWLTLMLADRVQRVEEGVNLGRTLAVGACVLGAVALGVAVSRRT